MPGSTARAGAARLPGAGMDGPRGWLLLERAFVCTLASNVRSSSRRQSKARSAARPAAPSWSKPAVFLEREKRKASLPMRRGCGPDCGRGDQCWLHQRCHSRPARRYWDRLMSLPPLPSPVPPPPRDPEAMGRDYPLPFPKFSVSQTLSGQRRNKCRVVTANAV